MKATDIKMYISTLSIIKKGQEIECGDFLGGRKVNASQEDALNSMKNAVYMYLFASIMKKDKGYKTMAFTITACNSAIYDNSMKTEVVSLTSRAKALRNKKEYDQERINCSTCKCK